MRFYIVRHGETEANVLCLSAGISESPLTDKGTKQAQCTAKALADVKFDVAYSSPLSRAYDTAEIVADGKCDVVIENELHDMNCGEWENRNFDELDREYPEPRRIWRENYGSGYAPGGESMQDIYDRVTKAFLKIVKECEGKDNILIATHALPVLAIACYVRGIVAKDMKREELPSNASYTVIDVVGDKMTLVRLGEDEHLGELVTKMKANA